MVGKAGSENASGSGGAGCAVAGASGSAGIPPAGQRAVRPADSGVLSLRRRTGDGIPDHDGRRR